MKKIKKLIKYLLCFFELIYFKIRYANASLGIINLLAIIDKEAGGKLPCDYTWGERYMYWVEYLRRRSIGIKCTFEEVEFEYLKEWNDKFQEAKKRFEEYRKENPIEDALL